MLFIGERQLSFFTCEIWWRIILNNCWIGNFSYRNFLSWFGRSKLLICFFIGRNGEWQIAMDGPMTHGYKHVLHLSSGLFQMSCMRLVYKIRQFFHQKYLSSFTWTIYQTSWGSRSTRDNFRLWKLRIWGRGPRLCMCIRKWDIQKDSWVCFRGLQGTMLNTYTIILGR